MIYLIQRGIWQQGLAYLGRGGNEAILLMQIMQLGHYQHMQLETMHNAEIFIHAPLLLASSNTVIIMFDFEPFNSVITTHYFSVFFDLYSL